MKFEFLHLLSYMSSALALTCPARYMQVCYLCSGEWTTCNKGSLDMTEEQCIAEMDGVTIVAVHYNPSNNLCPRYTCTDNIDYDDTSGSQRRFYRFTTNPDCKIFTIEQTLYHSVSETYDNIAYGMSRSQCFYWCFDVPGCYTFSHDSTNSVCKIYTHCGVSCSQTISVYYRVYTRRCHDECEPLVATDRYNVSMPCGRNFGDLAEYTCQDGYELAGGNAIVICQDNGTWNSTGAECVPVVCDQPTLPEFGTVVYTNGMNYTSVASYSCDLGYELQGSAEATCLANKTWSSETPLCVPVDCNEPASPEGGAVNISNGTTYQNIAIYTCSIGNVLLGNDTSVCLSNGSWNGSTPSCEPIQCVNLTSPDFGLVDMSDGINYDSIAMYSCNEGYYLTGPSSRTCLINGEWSETAPWCSPVDCGPLQSPAKGFVSLPNGTSYLQIALYDCYYGYNLSGVRVQNCKADGRWSDEAPSCHPVDCGPPIVPANGSVSVSHGTMCNMSVFYDCTLGYKLIGSNVSTCLNTSEWSHTGQVCVIYDCGNLTAPGNGSVVIPSGTTFGETALFFCDTGFVLNGAETLSCEDYGVWSGEASVCDIIDCGPLEDPANGLVAFHGGTVYQAEAEYTCSPGYYLSRTENRTCAVTGRWTHREPVCVQEGTVYVEPVPKLYYIVPCIHYPNKTWVNLTESEIIEQLIRDTKIQKNDTTLAVYKLKSRDDRRTSSRVFGLFGSVFIAVIFACIVFLDLSTICKCFTIKTNSV